MRQKKQRTTFFSSLQHSCRDQEKKYNDHKNDMDTLFIVRIAHWSYSIYLKCCLMTSYDIFIVSSTSLFNNQLRDNKSVLLRSTHRLCVCVLVLEHIYLCKLIRSFDCASALTAAVASATAWLKICKQRHRRHSGALIRYFISRLFSSNHKIMCLFVLKSSIKKNATRGSNG